MGRLWSEQGRFERWLEVELAATDVLAERGVVPRAAILDKLEISLATFKRDLEYMRERFNAPVVWDRERGFFHDGPASRDVVALFEDAATALPPDLAAEIRQKVHEFAGRQLTIVSRRKKFRRAAWQR